MKVQIRLRFEESERLFKVLTRLGVDLIEFAELGENNEPVISLDREFLRKIRLLLNGEGDHVVRAKNNSELARLLESLEKHLVKQERVNSVGAILEEYNLSPAMIFVYTAECVTKDLLREFTEAMAMLEPKQRHQVAESLDCLVFGTVNIQRRVAFAIDPKCKRDFTDTEISCLCSNPFLRESLLRGFRISRRKLNDGFTTRNAGFFQKFVDQPYGAAISVQEAFDRGYLAGWEHLIAA